MFLDHLAAALEHRQKQGLLRQRLDFDDVTARTLRYNGQSYLNFASNDYLGLASQVHSIDCHSGSQASPLVVGRQSVHRQFEQELLEWLEVPNHYSAMLFSSGYSANAGVLHGLFNDKDDQAVLVQDKLNHASLMSAGQQIQALGHARHLRFVHNDNNQLANVLAKNNAASKRTLVVTEGIFSMDGDGPDLTSFQRVCDSHNCAIMIDDAHAIGWSGENGRGSVSQLNLEANPVIIVIPFGKGLGGQGAAVVAPNTVIEYLVNFSKEYVYSTHVSPSQVAMLRTNLATLKTSTQRREKLSENIRLFRECASAVNLPLLASQSPIQPIMVGDELTALSAASACREQGVWLTAMRYPTVAKHSSRLRVTITSEHKGHDINKLVLTLREVLNRVG